MNIVNQYSYVIGSLAILGAAFLVLRRLRFKGLVTALAQLAFVAVLVTGFLVLRPGNSNVDTTEAAEAVLANGRPTFMEFFSNYCGGCLVLQPVVNNIVSNIEEDYNILRVDIHTPLGRDLREKLGFSFTPEFVVFDDQGQEIWRAHLPPSDEQLNAVIAKNG